MAYAHFPTTDHLYLLEVTIPAGLPAVSPAVDLRHKRLAGIRMPPAWIAADIAFSESPDAGVVYPWLDVKGAQIDSVDIGPNISLRLNETMLTPYRYVRLHSVMAGGGPANPVDQTAPRVLGLLLVPRP